jgi:D-glycero-D-manno-heptose 1,7-bisphosphate phosphatase
MSRPAIFFDRDNTLIVSGGYLAEPALVKLIDRAADAVARARGLGFAVVTFSNQSGVARGMFSEDDVRAVNAQIDRALREADPAAIVDRHEFCPFHPEATVEQYRRDSELRKPQPGMILRAASELDLDLRASWVIGDAPRDIAAGQAAGCRTILFVDPALAPSPAARELPDVEPDYVASSLGEAIDLIERELEHRPAATVIRQATAAHAPDRLVQVGEQILQELRRRDEQTHADFSVPRLLAGIVQVLVLAALFVCYLNRSDAGLPSMLMFVLILQTLVIALLLMGRK